MPRVLRKHDFLVFFGLHHQRGWIITGLEDRAAGLDAFCHKPVKMGGKGSGGCGTNVAYKCLPLQES